MQTISPARCAKTLIERLRSVRATTERLCQPLEPEDYQLQSMPDCSPPKWHLAHTTWFFETFILEKYSKAFKPFHPKFGFLFNSYYETVGARWPRPKRGLLTRPTVAEVFSYRKAVEEQIFTLLANANETTLNEIAPLIEIGINHEQQHQELLLTDLKNGWSLNPLFPTYPATRNKPSSTSPKTSPNWREHQAGVHWIGFDGDGFSFDNESPRHRVFVDAFALSSHLVTVGAYLEFIEAGGYDRPEYWLSDGWAARQQQGWTCPLYWHQDASNWSIYTLREYRDLDHDEPVCHISFYEADAYARWAGCRLPTEAEWEVAITDWRNTALPSTEMPPDSRLHAGGEEVGTHFVGSIGNFLDTELFHPSSNQSSPLGNTWVWTASPYVAYPGYRPAAGALGEYNGKFMCNQMVLRGGSCVTPADHIRTTYRNFFPPDARWQFSGIRLAGDVGS